MVYYTHMARRTLTERHIRKISKVGGGRSISVTLPIEFIRELGWREKQKVVVKKKGKTLVIEDWEG
jgi:antitoxin component of MazEF toxin-antitoxin module